MNKGRGEEGIALVITLLVMTILLIMASAFMSISSTETLIAINERNRVQAYHLAEAGAERAIAQLNVDNSYGGTPVGADIPLGPGTYKVTVTCVPAGAPPCPPATPDQRIITAMGCVRNCTPPSATSRVEVRVQGGSPFQFALLGLNVVTLEDNVQVDSYDSALGPYNPLNPGTQGHIHSNGNISLLTNNTVKGSARAVGSVTLGLGSNIEGGYTQGVPSQSVMTNITYPPPSGSSAGISPSTAYNTTTHDLTVGAGLTVTLDPGTYSFNRIEVKAGGKLNITGPVVMYMTGQLKADNGAVINTSGIPTNLLIFSSNTGTDADGQGNEAVLFDNGSGEFYGGIYLLNGEMEVPVAPVGWKMFGAIVGKKIDIEDNSQFHYDLALARSSTSAGKFTPLAGTWQERL